MFRRTVATLSAIAAVSAAMAADYMFPSPNPPANLKASDVDQYICFIWDDNAYSGLKGTPYEPAPNVIWDQMSVIGGERFQTWGPTGNTLNLQEGDIGMSWAVINLLKNITNKNGSTPSMTFNVITGQMHPIFGSWSPTGDSQTGYKGRKFLTVNWSNPSQTLNAPVCWGREYANYIAQWGTYHDSLVTKYRDQIPPKDGNTNPNYGDIGQPNWTSVMYNMAKKAGHELGNHTIDHMESNSGLPRDLWPNNGEGFDPGAGQDYNFYGEKVTEQYAAWDVIGWDIDAGRKISQKAWKEAIQIGEEMLDIFCDVSIARGNLYSFRAPRLEINSGCLLALKELGYTYDCGLEEGYEANMDGTNARWPYTFDNGSPNVWVQKANGVKVAMDKFPAGLWEIPVNVFVVPEDIRQQVWDRHNQIALAANEGAPEPYAEWSKHGKITGFDFNMFILWGMTKADFVKTMKYNLDLRLANNKAPMQFGCHTDYYTPMYDNATLMNDINKSSYGLNITNNWNKFTDRIDALEEFVAYAQTKNVNFVSGIKLIEEMRKLQARGVVGTAYTGTAIEWEFFDGASSAVSTKPAATGNIENAVVTVPAREGVDCGYACYFAKGAFTNLDHVSLTYQTTAPLLLRLTVAGDDFPWEVLLNNVGTQVNSGNIPLSAFHRNQYYTGPETELKSADINGIEIAVLTNGEKQEEVTLNVTNFKAYGPSSNPFSTSVLPGRGAHFANLFSIGSMSANALKLNVTTAGRYSISIMSANGRTLSRFDQVQLNPGVNSLRLNNLPQGMYMIRVNVDGKDLVRKAMVL